MEEQLSLILSHLQPKVVEPRKETEEETRIVNEQSEDVVNEPLSEEDMQGTYCVLLSILCLCCSV